LDAGLLERLRQRRKVAFVLVPSRRAVIARTGEKEDLSGLRESRLRQDA
jgi:hypothetical protein